MSPDEWEEVCAREARLRVAIRKVSLDAAELREWWGAVSDLLHGYRLLQSIDVLQPIPDDLVGALQATAAWAATGNIIGFLDSTRGRGAPLANPFERDLVGWATIYLALAKQAVIVDPNPTKTVQDLYGVDRTTVQKWKRRAVPWSLSANLRASEAEYITEKLVKSGPIYKAHGFGMKGPI